MSWSVCRRPFPGFVVRAACIAGCLVLSSCSGPTAPSERVAFNRADVQVPLQRGMLTAGELVVRDEAAFAQVWAEVYSLGIQPPPPAPAIDWTREMVLVVSLGQLPTTGYRVEIESVFKDKNGLTVEYVATLASRQCFWPTAITYATDIVRVPRTNGPVRFERRSFEAC